MSEMKMSDVFGLPLVVCRTNPQMITAKPTYKGKTDFYYATIRSPVELEVNYATHAINNHDRMVEEIAELRGALLEHKEFTQLMHSMSTDWTVKRSIELHKETEQLLAKLNQEGEE